MKSNPAWIRNALFFHVRLIKQLYPASHFLILIPLNPLSGTLYVHYFQDLKIPAFK